MDDFFEDEKPKKSTKNKSNWKEKKQISVMTAQNNQEEKKSEIGEHQHSKKQENKAQKKQNQDKGKKGRKDRGKKDKKKPSIIEEVKKNNWEDLELPLIIKLHRSLVGCDGQEKKLEDFINYMYPEEKPAEKIVKDKVIRSFEKEDDEGNIEYKLKLVKPTDDRLDHLTTQMKFRIGEGRGEAYYRIGVEDDGKAIGLNQTEMFESLKTICTIASKNHADVTAFRIVQGIKGNIVELMITKNQKQGVKLEIRLLLMGQSGSGKSTLLGVIKSGEKDDGKGYSRTKVFQHKDEFMSGITQSKSHHVIAFDSKGKLYDQRLMMSMESWLQNSSKILSFIDVGGHKQKQVVQSLCSFFPEYALWVVSGENKSLSINTVELVNIFKLPLIVVITHLDKLKKQQQMQAVLRVKKELKGLYPDKTPCVIGEMELAVLFSRITSTEDVIPIFLISSVTGENIELLINFFNLLTSISQLRHNEELNSEFLISNIYNFGSNIVLAGTVIKGTIKRGQILQLGPDNKGTFRAVEVQSIQCMRVPVKISKCGQVCTIAIKLLSYAKQWLDKQPGGIRKGMVLIESKCNPKATHQFTAEFFHYGNSQQQFKITSKCQPVVNTLTTRQICSIIVMSEIDETEEVPSQITMKHKKKSKSIDIFQSKVQNKCNKNSNSSYSIVKSNKNLELKEKKLRYGIKKQSEDLTDVIDIDLQKIQKRSILTPITEKQESKIKKKKDKDIQIKFSDSKPTNLRLRFKYMPEFLEKGQKLVISELKLIGKVTELHY